MTLSMVLLLIVIAAAVVLFSIEKLPTEVNALCILLALILLRLIPPADAFAGFGSDSVVLIFCLLVLTAALTRTGVVDHATRLLQRLAGDHPKRLLPIIMLSTTALSAFISNTATAAMFVPVTLELARRAKVSISKLLMPLAFASILASSITLVASSTNIVVSNVLTDFGMKPLGMFELAGIGLPVAAVGTVYMLAVGKRLIPDRTVDDQPEDGFAIRPYLAEIIVLKDSPLAGKTLMQAALGRDFDLTVLRIARYDNRLLVPQANLVLQVGDELLVKGQRNDVLKIRGTNGLRFKADVGLDALRGEDDDTELVEAILMPNSQFIGRTLIGLRFRQRFGLQVLGVNRGGENIFSKLSQMRFRVGDQLLIQGARTNIAALDQDAFHVIGTVDHTPLNRQRAPIAMGLFIAAVLLSAVKIVDLPVAVLIATLGVFVTRCITPDEAYRSVSWSALIVIGCMLALGRAMVHTGTADYIAGQLTGLVQGMSPYWLLTLFFGLTMILTQPMSNQAAAVLILPIAIQTAQQLGLNPRTFAVMIAAGASCSFITPLEPACLMVYSPGRYKFFDFVKVGSFLTLLVFGIALLLVPIIWPL